MLSKAYLEITNICNLHCSFCHGTRRAGHMISDAEFEVLTDRLVGKVHFLYFHLMGEPLLHPHLPQFIRRAREKGFTPILTTNGSLLATRGAALLEQLPHKISISLHAPAANAAFADPAYLQNCLHFARQAAARGCITVLRLWNLGGEGEGENAAILQALHAVFPGEWPNAHRDSLRLAERIFLEWGKHFEWPDPAAPAAPKDAAFFCYGLRNHIGILCDGTVVPCCLDADGNIPLGNLFSTPLEDILQTPRARAIYEGFSNRCAAEELCRRCGYAARFRT